MARPAGPRTRVAVSAAPGGGGASAATSEGAPAQATRAPSGEKTQIASTESHPACARRAASTSSLAPGVAGVADVRRDRASEGPRRLLARGVACRRGASKARDREEERHEREQREAAQGERDLEPQARLAHAAHEHEATSLARAASPGVAPAGPLLVRSRAMKSTKNARPTALATRKAMLRQVARRARRAREASSSRRSRRSSITSSPRSTRRSRPSGGPSRARTWGPSARCCSRRSSGRTRGPTTRGSSSSGRPTLLPR